MSRKKLEPTLEELKILALEAEIQEPVAITLEPVVLDAGIDNNGKDARPVKKRKQEADAVLPKIKALGTGLINQYQVVHIHGTKHFYVYSDTHYVKRDPLFFNQLFERSECFQYLSNKKNNDELILFLKRSTSMSREDFQASTEGFINFKNGHYNKKTKQLTCHAECPTGDATRYFTYCLPFDCDPNAYAPKWEELMAQCFMARDGRTLDLESIRCLYEYMGYTLSGDENWADKFLLMVGPSGANGKSLINNIMKRLLGKDAFSVIPASILGSETGRINLTGKLANISAEEPVDAFVKNEATIKSLTSKDTISARALHNDSGQVDNRAKLWFACNEALTSHDVSGGFLRRPIILNFNNKAVDADEYDAEKATYRHGLVYKKDVNLESRLSEELPGIFNLAMSAYEVAKERGQLTIPSASKEAVKEIADGDLVTDIVISAFEAEPSSAPMLNRDIMLTFQNEMAFRQIKTQISQKRIVSVLKTIFGAKAYRTMDARGLCGVRAKIVAPTANGSKTDPC